jgi:soluble lytic murein transglycosylase
LEGLEAAKEAAWLVFNGKLPPPEFSNTDRLERAGNLHRRGRFDLAAATYRKLLEKDPGNQDLKIKLARALYKKRDNTDAIDLLKEILGSKITAEQRSEAVHLLSLLFWRVDMAKEFEKTCDYLREDGSLRFKKKAVFNLGAHHLEQGRLDKANHYFSEYLKLEKARSARSAVLWKKAWIHYHQDQFMDAARSFRKAAESSPGASLTNPATYWEARALLQSGKQKRAIDLLKRVVVRAPLDYYGQQAAALLESKGVRPPESPLFGRRFPDVSLTNKHRSHPHVAAALKLHETGFPEFAYLNLAALPSSMKSERPIAFLMARVSRAAGRHRRAYDILYRHFASFMQAPPSSAPKEFIDMAFPRLLFDETLRVARKHEMDPNLVWAVMRQESRYDATAVSPAGALGLMQVTPRATRLVAKHQQQIPAEAIEKILNPANNLRFGVKILADTLRSFDGALAPAIASYNADIRKVRQWVERGKHLDEDEFIDNIPYSETRLYVKKVLAGYRAYEYLHRKKDLASHW